METLYKAYKDKVQFFLVYTREIHPTHAPRPGQPKRPSRYGSVAVEQHNNMQDRIIAADKCMKGLKLTLPILLDSMDNLYTKTYSGMPAGTCVIDIDGKIAYWNRGAPTGARPPQAEAAIKKLLAAGGAAKPTEWAKVKWPRPKPAKKAGPAPTAKKAPAKEAE